MRTFDFAPLYRSTIGFDHLTSLLDAVPQREQTQPSYPLTTSNCSARKSYPNCVNISPHW